MSSSLYVFRHKRRAHCFEIGKSGQIFQLFAEGLSSHNLLHDSHHLAHDPTQFGNVTSTNFLRDEEGHPNTLHNERHLSARHIGLQIRWVMDTGCDSMSRGVRGLSPAIKEFCTAMSMKRDAIISLFIKNL